jgi:hypothetical protein
VSDALRHNELAVLLRPKIGTEQDVPEAEFHAVIARIAIALGDIDGVMPAVHLWGNEQVIQDFAFHVSSAMGEKSADVRGGNG